MKNLQIFITLILGLSINMMLGQHALIQSYNMPSELFKDHTFTYPEYIKLMDSLWQQTPHDFKGSGYKPYLRWKENSRHLLKPDLSMRTMDEIEASWNQVKNWTNLIDPMDDSSSWIPIGPFSHINSGSWSSGQGRVNICTVDPNNPNTIYIGTPNGGAWKSTDHGNSWISMTDALPVWGVSGIAIDYNNSNIIYVATGDDDGWNSYANGVWKSTDGGSTWTEAGSINSQGLGEIFIHPTNSNILWVCSSDGLYRSNNAGNSWTLVDNLGSVRSIRLKPGNPDIIYTVVRSNTSLVRKSTNGGLSFSTIRAYPHLGRTLIDVTDANPNVLYVLNSTANNNFYQLDKSSDEGASFTTQNNSTDIYQSQQAYFDLALVVSNTNENRLFTGCLNIWYSGDGGQSFTQYNQWSAPNSPKYTHADIHELRTFNGNVYASTDGGIYISTNGGVSFEDKTINGLNIGQFYRIDVAQNNQNQIAGGLQDNGGYALHNNQWHNYYGADGMDSVIDPTNPNHYYGFIQFGSSLYRFNSQTQSNSHISSSPNNISGNWITPLEMSSNGHLYAGYNRLYRLESTGFSLMSTQLFNGKIREIKIAPNNEYIQLVQDEDHLYLSNGSSNMSFQPIDIPQMGDITTFGFHSTQDNVMYVCGTQGIYKSTNGGASWQNISYNIPLNSNFTGIVHQESSVNNTLYVSTVNAVYYINDNMTSWQIFANGLPHTRINDIKVNNVENHVIIATYGRGIWRSPVDSESLEVEDIDSDDQRVYFYPNPTQDFLKLNVSFDEKSTVTIMNLEGRLLDTQYFDSMNEQSLINMQNVPKGVYLIKLVSATHLIVKKIIKE